MRDFDLESHVTAPETAWLIGVVPVALAVAAMLVVVWLLRGRLLVAMADLYAHQAAWRREQLPPALVPDGALVWVPQTAPPATFVALCTGAAVVLLAGMALLAPMYLSLILAAPVTALLVWALLRTFEARYISRLERELTAAVGRLSALLRSGNAFRQALEKVVAGATPGPLQQEWRFLLERQGVPLVGGERIATPQQVVAALSVQTPSMRHAVFLNHLAVAVDQPQDVLVTRVTTAYEGLQASDRRREEAMTELAQMRYSGIAVGLAGVVMALYLTWTQWDRVVIAYRTPMGVVVGVFVVAALLLPVVGGMLLARAEDVDY